MNRGKACRQAWWDVRGLTMEPEWVCNVKYCEREGLNATWLALRFGKKSTKIKNLKHRSDGGSEAVC